MDINAGLLDSLVSDISLPEVEAEQTVNIVKSDTLSNVVTSSKMKEVQRRTLNLLREYLAKTYGPMGSYTAIISGSNDRDISTTYSKDGLKVLKHILFDSPIELAIQAELSDICRYVEKQVGDGTTSAVIISSLIYNELVDYMSESPYPPRVVLNAFKEVVKILQDSIQGEAKELDLDDIYNICMISTNGNEEVSKDITDLYKQYGFSVNIDVSISNDPFTKIKEYDGLTINEGYSDPAYINNINKGTAEIHNAKVYHFADPVDTPQMISYFEKILIDNIFTPVQEGTDLVPTVIVCPILSRDGNGLLSKLVEILHQYDVKNMQTQKPEVLIITNILGTDEGIAADICRLCNTKSIRKYINDDVEKHDQETGNAVSMDTIHDFAGYCELVVADEQKTKFINPDDIKNGESKIYNGLINFLKSEVKKAQDNNEDHLTLGRIKKRLNCLEANMIEFLVGGITVSDRDAVKDLVEDAVKNCASAAENGVGYAANFQGLKAAFEYYVSCARSNVLHRDIVKMIFEAYYNATYILYSTVATMDKVPSMIKHSLEVGHPYNVAEYIVDSTSESTNVLCSIRTDIEVLNAISKIVTIMATSNQCLLQAPSLNGY